MLFHLAFSSNVLGNLASSHYVLRDLFRLFVIWVFGTWMCLTWVFFTWAIVAWLTFVGRLTYHRFMALCANLSLLHGSPLYYGHRQDMGWFVCFRHTSDVFGRGTLWLINQWFANSLCWVFIVNVRHIFILDRTTNNSLVEYTLIYYHKYYAMSSTGNIS